MRVWIRSGVSTLAGMLFALSGCVHAQTLDASTKQGIARGKLIQDGKVKAFLGLPYAKPPVDGLRWKAPVAPVAWTGVRDATQFGHRCGQWPIWKDYVFLDPGPSEDCLYLNVYAPAGATAASKLPVMFWIHGGGYTAGAGSEPRYTNSGLVPRGVVLVTINYRLGLFGFLATKQLAAENAGSAGNYGLMDMVAALRWVRENIGNFGGDASNVTIFGESAGSFAVSTLLAVPEAKGLFSKAIGESGAVFSDVLPLSSLEERSGRDQQWADSLGANNLKDLRAMPTAKLVEAASRQPVGWFSPVVDGHFVPAPVPEIYAAGRQAHVPVIIGWNRDERTNTLSKDLTAEKWKAFATEHYGAQAGEFLKAFPAATDAEAMKSADDYTTDQFIAQSAWRWAEAEARTNGAPVYRYRFDRPATPSEMHPEGRYAFHSDELEFVFGTLDTRAGATWQPADRTLSDQLMDYWTNFARTGNPNGKDLPQWPRYDTQRSLVYLDDPITAGGDRQLEQHVFLLHAAPTKP